MIYGSRPGLLGLGQIVPRPAPDFGLQVFGAPACNTVLIRHHIQPELPSKVCRESSTPLSLVQLTNPVLARAQEKAAKLLKHLTGTTQVQRFAGLSKHCRKIMSEKHRISCLQG